MSYCPNCGSTNVHKIAFNLYNGGDYGCSDCEVEYYFGITKRDIYATEECGLCGNEQHELKSMTLDGTDDFYNLEVCDECYEKYGEDYISPEQVDELMSNNK